MATEAPPGSPEDRGWQAVGMTVELHRDTSCLTEPGELMMGELIYVQGLEPDNIHSPQALSCLLTLGSSKTSVKRNRLHELLELIHISPCPVSPTGAAVCHVCQVEGTRGSLSVAGARSRDI